MPAPSVLAIDPGGTTGMARWERTPGGESFEAWQEDDPVSVLKKADYLAWAGKADVLVCESFQISAATSKKSTAGSAQTIELIGALRWIARTRGAMFVLQTPADARSFATDEKLRRVGWWTAGQDHARSATWHLLLYLVRGGLVDRADLL